MSENLVVNVWHRCGTCGSIFPSLVELNSHVERGHSGDSASFDNEARYPTSLPARGRLLYAQFTDLPHAQ
jgi:hypothetical protein